MARKVYHQREYDDSETPSENVDAQLQTQTRELYTNFIHEEIQSHGLDVPATLT